MATLFFFVLTFSIIISIVWWSYRNGISPMPTSYKTKKALLKALPKEIEGTIVDLGSGWGTLLFPLAKQYPNCQIIGYETSPIPYYVSKILQRINSQKNIELKREDFFSVSLKNATMVICYLYPGAMKKLNEKFEDELQSGTWVISHTFALPNWKPIEVIDVKDLYRTKIYLYKKS